MQASSSFKGRGKTSSDEKLLGKSDVSATSALMAEVMLISGSLAISSRLVWNQSEKRIENTRGRPRILACELQRVRCSSMLVKSS